MSTVPDFGVYIHWPFCKSKCPYCDFNSHVRERIDEARWRQALLAELDAAAVNLPGRRVSSIFFGGGTPSLMEPETVAALIERVARHWNCDGTEITLEANPTSVEAARFRELRAAGVNRVSLGVPALEGAAMIRHKPTRRSISQRRISRAFPSISSMRGRGKLSLPGKASFAPRSLWRAIISRSIS
jgi:oxygen-independent coproporphyrinogen-3 oxidase